jgi:hypothetical protein
VRHSRLQYQAVLRDVAVPNSSNYAGVGASGESLLPLSRGPTQVGTTPGLAFRVLLSEEHVELEVAL